MKDLFFIPAIKMKYSVTFWLILISILALPFFLALGISNIADTKIGDFTTAFETFFFYPNVWQNICWIVYISNYFISFLLILHVTDDNRYNLIRHHVITGWSRIQVLQSYFYVCLIFSCLVLIQVVILGAYFGIRDAYETEFITYSKILLLLCFFLQSFIRFQITIMIALFFRTATPAILALILWNFALEPLLAWIFSQLTGFDISQYLPLGAIRALIPNLHIENFGLTSDGTIPIFAIALGILYMIAFGLGTWHKFKHSDL